MAFKTWEERENYRKQNGLGNTTVSEGGSVTTQVDSTPEGTITTKETTYQPPTLESVPWKGEGDDRYFDTAYGTLKTQNGNLQSLFGINNNQNVIDNFQKATGFGRNQELDFEKGHPEFNIDSFLSGLENNAIQKQKAVNPDSLLDATSSKRDEYDASRGDMYDKIHALARDIAVYQAAQQDLADARNRGVLSDIAPKLPLNASVEKVKGVEDLLYGNSYKPSIVPDENEISRYGELSSDKGVENESFIRNRLGVTPEDINLIEKGLYRRLAKNNRNNR